MQTPPPPAPSTTVEIRTSYSDGLYHEDVEVEPPTTPAQQVAETLEAVLFDSAAPSQGATQLYAAVVDRSRTADDELPHFDAPAVSGPLTAPQEWLSGRPVAAPQVYDPSRGRRFFPVDTPTMRPEVGLWAAPLRGRNGGFALAQYDPSRDRHRWLLWSRFTVNATRASWGPHTGDVRLAFGWSQHSVYRWERGREGIFVLDLRNGTAHRLALPIELHDGHAYQIADGPEDALAALGAVWTRDGVRYRGRGGRRETVHLGEIRAWLDASTGASWSGPGAVRPTRDH